MRTRSFLVVAVSMLLTTMVQAVTSSARGARSVVDRPAPLRERRPLLTAFLLALAVSLLVNDSPNDVIVAGLAGYLALSTAPGVARPADERVSPAVRGPRAQSAPAASP